MGNQEAESFSHSATLSVLYIRSVLLERKRKKGRLMPIFANTCMNYSLFTCSLLPQVAMDSF